MGNLKFVSNQLIIIRALTITRRKAQLLELDDRSLELSFFRYATLPLTGPFNASSSAASDRRVTSWRFSNLALPENSGVCKYHKSNEKLMLMVRSNLAAMRQHKTSVEAATRLPSCTVDTAAHH
ncbi:hypothetical protein E2P81_ATG07525 [Venturia nashicola]|uniref:Uncharacterized protein n=1 Tax=Venturia nashicola TaxID=86259 RepID=A0A4Z1P777_9PEZI|nr:hypothetical protein E6O75_ATG07685 [Venturia nashicola]TLD32035.1 hypothetical protein E2P81_ATG07525 [Venturia nashicola]